jgi:hypothetical protein
VFNLVTILVVTKFGDKFFTKFGEVVGDQQI